MRKHLIVVFAALTCLFTALFIVGCKQSGEQEIPTQPILPTYTIEGACDRYFSLADSGLDFSGGVTVESSDGSAATVKVDSSAVRFGEAGVYDVFYSCGETTVVKKAYVLAMPVLKAKDDAKSISAEYAEVQEKLYYGLEATDGLGEKLDIAYVTGTENPLFDDRDIPQYGSHEVTYSATDRVGQTVTFTRIFNVIVGDDTPELIGIPSADVADETTEIEFDLKGNDVSVLYIGDVQFDQFAVTQNGIAISVADLSARYSVGSYDATLMTSGGYVDFTFLLKDEKPIALNWYGLDNWSYVENSSGCSFPKPEKLYPRQDFELNYQLKTGGETVLSCDDGIFSAPKAGIYTLCITAKREKTNTVETKDLRVSVLTQSQKDSVLAMGDSLQNANELPFSFQTVNNNPLLLKGQRYSEDEGVGPAYKMSGKAGGGDYCFSLVLSGKADGYGGSEIDAKYNTVVMDLYTLPIENYNPWMQLIFGLETNEGGIVRVPIGNRDTAGKDNILNGEKVRVYSILSDGSTGGYTAPQHGVWQRYVVSLADYRNAAVPFLWLGNEYGGTFYVRRVCLSESVISEEIPHLNNGLSSEIAPHFDRINLTDSEFNTNVSLGGRNGLVSMKHAYTLAEQLKNDIRSLTICFGTTESERIVNARLPQRANIFRFDFYAQRGADLWFSFGHSAAENSLIIESAKTSENFCVYDGRGKRIAVPTEDGWYTAEVSLARANSCNTYIRMGIADNTSGHILAVDPQSAVYLKKTFAASPTPNMPMIFNRGYENIKPYFDTAEYGSGAVQFSENQTVGGRNGVVTLQTVSAGDRQQRAIGFGALAGNNGTIDTGIPTLYQKMVMDVYATKGADLSVLFGHCSELGLAFANITDIAVVKVYEIIENGRGSQITDGSFTDRWVRIEIDLKLYRQCCAGSYGRIALCNVAEGTSVSVDPTSVEYAV